MLALLGPCRADGVGGGQGYEDLRGLDGVDADALHETHTSRSLVSALGALRARDVTTLKSFIRPPRAVVHALEAVCVALGAEPSWSAAKKLMSNAEQFVTALRAFDVDRASRKVTNAKTRQIPALTKGEIHSMKAARQIGTRASSSSQCISRLKTRLVSALYR